MEAELLALARTVAKAWTDFADDLEASATPEPAVATRRTPYIRGPQQRAAYETLVAAGPDGMKTKEVGDEIKQFQTNAWNTLRALERAGLVEIVPGAYPQRWRAV